MASYDSSRDKIEVLGGRLISVQRAKHMISSLQSAVDVAEEYKNNSEYQEVNMNEMALNHLLEPSEKDYILEVDISCESKDELECEFFDEIIKENEKYGHIEARIEACDIKPLFDESTGVNSFHIYIPSRD